MLRRRPWVDEGDWGYHSEFYWRGDAYHDSPGFVDQQVGCVSGTGDGDPGAHPGGGEQRLAGVVLGQHVVAGYHVVEARQPDGPGEPPVRRRVAAQPGVPGQPPTGVAARLAQRGQTSGVGGDPAQRDRPG